MSKIDDDNKAMEGGVRKILGKEDYAPPTKVPTVCTHMTDGFVEDETERHILFKCILCGEMYKVPKEELQ